MDIVSLRLSGVASHKLLVMMCYSASFLLRSATSVGIESRVLAVNSILKIRL